MMVARQEMWLWRWKEGLERESEDELHGTWWVGSGERKKILLRTNHRLWAHKTWGVQEVQWSVVPFTKSRNKKGIELGGM